MKERLRIMDQESMEGDNLPGDQNGENGNDAEGRLVERQPATVEDIHSQSEFQDIDDILNELLAEYAPAETAPAEGEEPERREGKKERLQPVVVLASAFGGASAIRRALTAVGHIPIPGVAALTSGVVTFGISRWRRMIGKQTAFEQFCGYSFVEEGKKGIRGKIVKTWQILTRGLQRRVLKRGLGLHGGKEVRQLASYWHEQEEDEQDTAGRVELPTEYTEEVTNKTRKKAIKLTREALKINLAYTATQRLGAYYTESEKTELDRLTQRSLAAAREIMRIQFSDTEERKEVLRQLESELTDWEDKVYRRGELKIAGLSAATAAALTPIGTWLIEDATPQLLARFNSQIESVPGLTEAKANLGEAVQNVSDASRNAAKGIQSVTNPYVAEAGHTLAEEATRLDQAIRTGVHNISDQLDPTLKTHLGEAATSGQDALQHLGEAGKIVANTTQANFLSQIDRLTPYLNELGARKQEFGTMMQELQQFMAENWEQLNLQLDENTGADIQQLREEIGKLATGMGKAFRSTITPSDCIELKTILARIGNIFSVNRISR